MNAADTDDRRVVIIGPPPTPNGDLHVGHIAGPYLAADVHARYLRAAGRSVLYVSGTDDSQTYVVGTAARQGTSPEALADKSWHDIRAAFDAVGIAVDGFAPFDDGYRSAVLDFVDRLYRAGAFELRTVRMPYSAATGRYLMEGLVSGECPVCLAVSRGGLCESCGHPNNFDDLRDPWSTVDPDDPVTLRETQILVLPLERYRPQLEQFYAHRRLPWRPHMEQLVRELLARPLPDFPITYPTDWGIPAPFAETPGQVLNAWAEGMPASMYCTAVGQAHAGERPAAADELWRRDRDIQLVYFLGFDNAYFWGVTHLALLLAHQDRYVLPDTIVCNEFYELEHDKFSTSKGHVIWARDLLAEVPRDLVRFYLALTAPEHARTSFSSPALTKVAHTRLVQPWNDLVTDLAAAARTLGVHGAALPAGPAAHTRRTAMTARFTACYELPGFSMFRAADLISLHVQRLRESAAALTAALPELDAPAAIERLGDLYTEVGALAAAAAPILIDLGAAVAATTSRPGQAAPDSGPVRAVDLPTLPAVAPAQHQVPCTSP
ncbi:methionine--tRNA ligase [Micromonospora rosaria]|uniref:Methionine--tRNA ligase n=1 Tax=Micromonospora rosaria TaxID=47874 RepID=A0A136PVL2_9ACTN|nr:class I tRNA ligase family protein [Micromonospora rosaria]KXK62435.1 methionine--tRNA ligase [Micromonospora rosaria]